MRPGLWTCSRRAASPWPTRRRRPPPPELAGGGASTLLRAATATDRALMEAGIAAFVASVRGARDAGARTGALRATTAPLGALAMTLGLHALPPLREVRTAKPASLAGWTPSDVDVEGVPYADKARETARKARVAAAAAAKARAAAERAAAPPTAPPPPRPQAARRQAPRCGVSPR